MTVNVAQITDEFLVKEKDGSLKVWRKGELVPMEGESRIKNQESRDPSHTSPYQGEEKKFPLLTKEGSGVVDRVTKTPGASFYFSPHDELEVDKFRTASPQLSSVVSNIEPFVRRIIEESGLQNLTPDIRTRVERIVASRLRNIRDEVSMKEVFSRPVSAGGAGLTEAQVQQVAQVTEQYREKMERGESWEESRIMSPESREGTENIQSGVGSVVKPIVEIEPAISPTPPIPPLSKGRTVMRPTVTSKKLVADVASPSSLVGPVEELQQLSVTEWKRLASDIAGRVQKVRERIDVIAEDSLLEKAKAITAWKLSPVYKMYVAIGQECMERGASVEAVIKDRESRGEETITEEEFNAIADLNRSLQF